MDYKLLNTVIDESGLKRSYIARAIGISPKVFHDRTSGVTQWKSGEIAAFCNLLGLKKKQRDDIFFVSM